MTLDYVPPLPETWTPILTDRLRGLERVREAADKVAAYLTIEAEFSGDEADHSGLYELDAALGALAVLEEMS